MTQVKPGGLIQIKHRCNGQAMPLAARENSARLQSATPERLLRRAWHLFIRSNGPPLFPEMKP